MSDCLIGCLGAILVFVLFVSISFLATSGLIWLACWAFGWTFQWKIVFGIWIVMALIRSCFKSTTNVKEN